MTIVDLRVGTHAVDFISENQKCANPLARYLTAEGEWKAGVRPANVIETAEDITWILIHRDTARPRVVCGFCGVTRLVRNMNEADKWWRTHECSAEGWEVAA